MRLLEMSISAGALILLLAVLRRGRIWNLTKRTVMMLWMVALARLLLPGSLPVRNGIAAPVFGLLRRICSMHKDLTKEAGGKALAAIAPEAASSGAGRAVAGGSLLLSAAGWIWLAGMAGAGIYFTYSFWKEYRMLAQALPLESKAAQRSSACAQIQEACKTACRLAGICPRKKTVKIFVHDRIRSPLVYGIARQRIVIPKSLLHLEQEQMQYILTHEMVHVRRHDNLWKLLSAAAVCIHWFNPAVWLMYVLFARDLELSCDERVLSVHGSRGRQGYAMTLLTMAQNEKGTTLFCSGFLENPVKERIVAIMKYRKLTGIGVVCTVMLLAGATSVFATNGQATERLDGHVVYDSDGKTISVKFAEPVSVDEGKGEAIYSCYTDEDGVIHVLSGEAENREVESRPEDQIVYDSDGKTISVKFAEPVSVDEGKGEAIYSCYTDEDGVIHVLSGEAENREVESRPKEGEGSESESEKLREVTARYTATEKSDTEVELRADSESEASGANAVAEKSNEAELQADSESGASSEIAEIPAGK